MKVKDFGERLPGSLSLTFLMFPRFGVFAVMRGIFPFLEKQYPCATKAMPLSYTFSRLPLRRKMYPRFH